MLFSKTIYLITLFIQLFVADVSSQITDPMDSSDVEATDVIDLDDVKEGRVNVDVCLDGSGADVCNRIRDGSGVPNPPTKSCGCFFVGCW
jgi:hypothetical protein